MQGDCYELANMDRFVVPSSPKSGPDASCHLTSHPKDLARAETLDYRPHNLLSPCPDSASDGVWCGARRLARTDCTLKYWESLQLC